MQNGMTRRVVPRPRHHSTSHAIVGVVASHKRKADSHSRNDATAAYEDPSGLPQRPSSKNTYARTLPISPSCATTLVIMTMANYPPPPAYTPSASTELESIDTPILTPCSSVDPPSYEIDPFGTHSVVRASSAEYFSARPPPLQRPSSTIFHKLSISPEADVVSLSFPIPESLWQSRDIDLQDWATFVNHLIPYHDINKNSRNLEKRANDNKQAMNQNFGDGNFFLEERVSKGADQAAKSLDAAQRIGYMHKDRMADVISEWNVAFFGPRGVEILLDMGLGLLQNSILPDEALLQRNHQNDGPSNPPPHEPPYTGDVQGPIFQALSTGKEAIAAEGRKVLVDVFRRPTSTASASMSQEDQALFRFVGKGEKKIVKGLLDCGANVNTTDARGETPLFRAVQRGESSMVKLLGSYGANADVSFQGETALHRAVARGDSSVVKLLVKEVENANTMSNGETPLFKACSRGDSSVVKLLMDHPNIDVNVTNPDGYTPLYKACSRGDSSIVKLLLEHPSVDVNAADPDGNTPLYKAVSRGDTSIVKKLVTHGAVSDTKVLLRAAEKGESSIVKILSGNHDS
ncbi:MAG: hypothetical protein Q9214_006711 [Letrouitia sp. 1 TL-2023]